MPRLLVRSVAEVNDRLIVGPTIDRRPSRLIIHRSLVAITSSTISYDGSCHRYFPIVCDSTTTRRDRSRYATAAGDRSKHCRSVTPWPNRNQSYDPEIVRSGVTVALGRPLKTKGLRLVRVGGLIKVQFNVLSSEVLTYLNRVTRSILRPPPLRSPS